MGTFLSFLPSVGIALAGMAMQIGGYQSDVWAGIFAVAAFVAFLIPAIYHGRQRLRIVLGRFRGCLEHNPIKSLYPGAVFVSLNELQTENHVEILFRGFNGTMATIRQNAVSGFIGLSFEARSGSPSKPVALPPPAALDLSSEFAALSEYNIRIRQHIPSELSEKLMAVIADGLRVTFGLEALNIEIVTHGWRRRAMRRPLWDGFNIGPPRPSVGQVKYMRGVATLSRASHPQEVIVCQIKRRLVSKTFAAILSCLRASSKNIRRVRLMIGSHAF